MSMKFRIGCAIVVTACLRAAPGLAADPFSATSIPQASGYTSAAMSMRDVMKPFQALTANLPHIDAGEANWSAVVQNGSYNSAEVAQSGGRNVGFVVQAGHNNTALLQQLSSGQTAFILQHGVGNAAVVTQK